MTLDLPTLVITPVLPMNRPVVSSLTCCPTSRDVPVLSVGVDVVAWVGAGGSVSPSSVDISCRVLMIRLVSRARSFNLLVSSLTLSVCIEVLFRSNIFFQVNVEYRATFGCPQIFNLRVVFKPTRKTRVLE